MSVLAVCGWGVAAVVAWTALRLRHRLELVARAEHEVRGPAAVVLLVAERMRRDRAAWRHARVLEPELERLRLALADLTAARAGHRAAGHPRRVDLGRLAARGLEAWAPALRTLGRPVRLDWRAGETPVRADRGRLGQALGNLLANAAEHGRGPVELRAERKGGRVRVEVRNDRGRGLRIAEAAAEEAGGCLRVDADERQVVTALELPVEDDDAPRAA